MNKITFADQQHKAFYEETMKKVRYPDEYHKSLIYLLGISRDTREHFEEIYDIREGLIRPDSLRQSWITSGSAKILRLAFNLYTDRTPSVDNYRRKDQQQEESRKYSVGDIFCCGYAPYFWEAIRLRYPQYCG